MNKNELLKIIKKNIQDIYSISGKFEGSEELHQIDIDLALSKVRNLYDLLLTLNSGSTYTPQYQKEELLTKPEQQETIQEKPKENISETPVHKPEIREEKNEPKAREEKPMESVQKHTEPEQDEIPEVEIRHEPELEIEKPGGETPVKEETEDIPNNSPEIIADKFQSKKFVHDNISRKNNRKDVSSKLQSKPLKDINSAIGINDKFIFIKELFGNDKEHYYETIQVLNNFDSFENAVNFLDENFDWDSEDPNYERLKELVRRKYSAK